MAKRAQPHPAWPALCPQQEIFAPPAFRSNGFPHRSIEGFGLVEFQLPGAHFEIRCDDETESPSCDQMVALDSRHASILLLPDTIRATAATAKTEFGVQRATAVGNHDSRAAVSMIAVSA